MRKSSSSNSLSARARMRTTSDELVTRDLETSGRGRQRGVTTTVDPEALDGISSKSDAESFLRTLSTLEKEPPKTMII